MDERIQAEHLDRYLDDCITGAAPAAHTDSDLARLARRYLALGRAPAPFGARARVLSRIAPPHTPDHPNGTDDHHEASLRLIVLPTISANGRYAPAQPHRPQPPPPETLSRLVPAACRPIWLFAALLIAVLSGGLTVREGQTLVTRFASRALVAINAPTITGLAGADPLLEVTVPALLVPSGDSVRTCLSHITIPPHARSAWSAQDATCCPGARLNYVVSGTYMVWPEAPVEVLIAGRTPETMPAGSEITLQSGDAILMGSDTPYSADNPGETPVELIQQILASPPAFPRGTATLAGWDEHDYEMRDIPLRGGPITMRLLRVTLAPREKLQTPPGMELMQIALTNSSDRSQAPPVIGSISNEGSIVNIGTPDTSVYLLLLEPAGVSLMS